MFVRQHVQQCSECVRSPSALKNQAVLVLREIHLYPVDLSVLQNLDLLIGLMDPVQGETKEEGREGREGRW